MKGNFNLSISTQQCKLVLKWHFEYEVTSRNRVFIQNEGQMKSLAKVAKWLSEPTAAFGLLLSGINGNGKTTMVKAIRGLFNRLKVSDPVSSSFSSPYAGVWMVTARELYQMFVTSPTTFMRCRESYIIAIDELGMEETFFVQYGNRYKPLEELLSYRYDRMLPTILTTNLPLEGIRIKYGDRLADRFNEMMQVVHMPDVNFRDMQTAANYSL